MEQILAQIPVQIVLFLLISTGGVLCCFNENMRYEVMVPITCTAIVSVLFLFGIVGLLRMGVYFLTALCAGIYIVSFVHIINETIHNGLSCLKNTAKAFITPGAMLMLLFVLTASYANYGKQVTGWDEFSHWATVVKHMVIFDTLGCDKNYSFVSFKSYPPAMALFQFYIQRIVILFNPNMKFSEEHLFFAYQVFSVSFLFPFLGKLNFKKPYAWVVSVLICITILLFQPEKLSAIYIDPFLGLLAGTGMATVFLMGIDQNPMYRVLTLMIISILVLTKDAGLLFAVFTAISYAIMVIHRQEKYGVMSFVVQCSAPILAIVVPKVLWTVCLVKNGVQSLFGKIDLVSLVHVLIGKETSYRTEVLENYANKLTLPYPFFSVFGKTTSTLLLLAVLLFLSFVICRAYGKQFRQKQNRFLAVFLVLFVSSCVFVSGLAVVYMFCLVPGEGLGLASYERYMMILLYQLTFFCVLTTAIFMEYLRINPNVMALLLLIVYVSTGTIRSAYDYCIRVPVWYANEIRKQYNTYLSTINQKTGDDKVIYFISQGDNGYDYWCARYCLMPKVVNPHNTTHYPTWSIGRPDHEGDIFTLSMTAVEWKRILLQECDYVALFRVNPNFYEDFSSLFENPEDIAGESLFYVNKDTGFLEICR